MVFIKSDALPVDTGSNIRWCERGMGCSDADLAILVVRAGEEAGANLANRSRRDAKCLDAAAAVPLLSP
jgi:hypothetical protein